ncbi:MAG: FMN-binding glutamate synthase family protein [Candidatus Lokiarchaeota archaeon]|nr:FMN-binding glutamate synthase family protein [Candidatus Lokiarchaeota archaeon]
MELESNIRHRVPPKFVVQIDREKCVLCKRCTINCSYGALKFNGEKIVADNNECVMCKRCALMCPQAAIEIIPHQIQYSPHQTYDDRIRRIIYEQSSTGGVLLASCGNDLPYRFIFDDLLLDACQVTNPAIDPLREPIETQIFVGKKPSSLPLDCDTRDVILKLEYPPNIELQVPIIVGHMSIGSISYNACLSILNAVKKIGTLAGTGEGGLHKDFFQFKDHIISEVASGRFGVDLKYLRGVAALEIKIGQGAKPGHGGHLPGKKVSKMISETRMIPQGSDALSPYPHHDIYSIEDLKQLIGALKEITEYTVPVGVKIAAVHNVAPISSGIARAGADFITIDGFRGGTGAAPRIIRDHAGIPIELAIAAVDQRLREEGIRQDVSIFAGGSIRYSADMIKIIALGADAAQVSTPVLVAMGCTVCQSCHRGLCSWGIATQRADLIHRLDVDVSSKRIVNLFHAWNEELREILGAMGIDSVESLRGNRDRLRYIGNNPKIGEILGVKHAGE